MMGLATRKFAILFLFYLPGSASSFLRMPRPLPLLSSFLFLFLVLPFRGTPRSLFISLPPSPWFHLADERFPALRAPLHPASLKGKPAGTRFGCRLYMIVIFSVPSRGRVLPRPSIPIALGSLLGKPLGTGFGCRFLHFSPPNPHTKKHTLETCRWLAS